MKWFPESLIQTYCCIFFAKPFLYTVHSVQRSNKFYISISSFMWNPRTHLLNFPHRNAPTSCYRKINRSVLFSVSKQIEMLSFENVLFISFHHNIHERVASCGMNMHQLAQCSSVHNSLATATQTKFNELNQNLKANTTHRSCLAICNFMALD